MINTSFSPLDPSDPNFINSLADPYENDVQDLPLTEQALFTIWTKYIKNSDNEALKTIFSQPNMSFEKSDKGLSDTVQALFQTPQQNAFQTHEAIKKEILEKNSSSKFLERERENKATSLHFFPREKSRLSKIYSKLFFHPIQQQNSQKQLLSKCSSFSKNIPIKNLLQIENKKPKQFSTFFPPGKKNNTRFRNFFNYLPRECSLNPTVEKTKPSFSIVGSKKFNTRKYENLIKRATRHQIFSKNMQKIADKKANQRFSFENPEHKTTPSKRHDLSSSPSDPRSSPLLPRETERKRVRNSRKKEKIVQKNMPSDNKQSPLQLITAMSKVFIGLCIPTKFTNTLNLFFSKKTNTKKKTARANKKAEQREEEERAVEKNIAKKKFRQKNWRLIGYAIVVIVILFGKISLQKHPNTKDISSIESSEKILKVEKNDMENL